MKPMLSEFILYLTEQLQEPYLWGGQHTRLTPENYVAVIKRKEALVSNQEKAIAYCEKMFAKGYTVLYAYDCSGLGMYWLYNLKKLYGSDLNANSLMGHCELVEGPPKRGYWVFKLNGNRATHIGYMVDDEWLIEAKGRAYGVARTKFKAKDWQCWGIPDVFRAEIVEPPAPPAPEPERFVEVLGKSVNVRTSDSKKGRVLFVAHKGDRLPFVTVAPSGWYEVLTSKGTGFITNLPRYTRLVE